MNDKDNQSKERLTSRGGAGSGREQETESSTSPPTNNSNKMAGASGVSRRQTYVSVNHLLSFEVTSTAGSGSGGAFHSSPPKRSLRHGGKPGASFTKERFIHANFRFVALDEGVAGKDVVFSTDPDAPLEWNDMELVIVPAQHDVVCPICLDTPVVPRLTKCGHFFCWSCILRYAAANSMAGSGNWRKCPICFESINTKQLKSVFFSQVDDYTSGGVRLSEVGIPMVLLKSHPSTCKVTLADDHLDSKGDSQSQHTLDDLSPFYRISFVGRQFIRENVIDVEARELEARLRVMSDSEGDDSDRIYLELALTMVEDRRQALESYEAVIHTNGNTSPPPVTSQQSSPLQQPTFAVFFHQSADGQPFFLCPLSIKMLKRQYGAYEALPRRLTAPVLEIEMAVMTEELRKRHRYLHHLPIGCQFGLCEVDLTGAVSSSVMDEFAGELQTRASNRKRKAHREEKLAAEANRRALQRQYQYLEDTAGDSRTVSPAAPGVAMGIFTDDYENFPLPPGSKELISTTQAIPIAATSLPNIPVMPQAGSFASIAATSPQSEGFLIIPPTTAASTITLGSLNGAVVSNNAFELSFDDLPSTSSAAATNASKKGKRVILVSNAQRRQS